MARKTKRQAQETRQHILDAAIKAFSERGVSATSLNDIAALAGVTRGASKIKPSYSMKYFTRPTVRSKILKQSIKQNIQTIHFMC